MKHIYINFRAPADLIARLDAVAEAESKRTGLPVGRSAVIRRAIEQDITRREQEKRGVVNGGGK